MDDLRGGALLAVETLTGVLDDRRKTGCVTHGDVGQDLPVQQRPGGLEPGDQLRIGDSVHARGGVDARDPERSELALAILPAGEGEVETSLDLLPGDPVTARLHPVVALGQLQDLDAAVLPLTTSLDSRHCSLLVWLWFRAAGSGVVG